MSHRYLLDTNVLAELARNPAGPAARTIAAVGETSVCTSAIVACEVHYGLARGASRKLADRMLEILATIDVLTNLPGDIGIHYGRIRAQLESAGDPHAIPDESDWEWVEFETARSLRPGMFVAQVVGKSMEPRIPDGAYCLFASPVTGTRQGRTVLVQLRDALDPDTGERFTVKRYRSEKTAGENDWRHVRILLEPVNPAFMPIELRTDDEGSVAVVAELVEVIGSEPPA